MLRTAGLIIVLLALPLAATPPAAPKQVAEALAVRIYPAAPIYTIDVDASHDLRSVMLQNLAVLNLGEAPVRLDRLTIEIRSGAQVRQTLQFDGTNLDAAAAHMAKLRDVGALALYDFAFQTSRYLPAGTALAGSRLLPARSALTLNGIPLVIRGAADRIRILAEGERTGGARVQQVLDVPLHPYAQKNNYRFPLNGVWFVVVGPGFSEPHRWLQNEEFALDIVRTGATGTTHSGSGTHLPDYYGYGQEVVAVADGEVVTAEAGQMEGEDRFRRSGESAEAFLDRTVAEQEALLHGGAIRVMGNYVIVRHSGGEYSHYAHLAASSVQVKAGDKVSGGQILGKLGSTGNSTEPHLHFTVANGPDPLYARSLPVRYLGLTTAGDGPLGPSYPQSGWIIDTAGK